VSVLRLQRESERRLNITRVNRHDDRLADVPSTTAVFVYVCVCIYVSLCVFVATSVAGSSGVTATSPEGVRTTSQCHARQST